MTRGKFYLITPDGALYSSPEFNGDMYPEDDGYGKDAIEVLEELRTEGYVIPEKFKSLVKIFNAKHHKYDDIPEELWIRERGASNELIGCIRNSYTDYSYVLDMMQDKVRVFCFSDEITDEKYIKEIVKNTAYETVTVDIPNDLYERLVAAGKEHFMTAEEYASMILEEASKDGAFEQIVLKELSNTQDAN